MVVIVARVVYKPELGYWYSFGYHVCVKLKGVGKHPWRLLMSGCDVDDIMSMVHSGVVVVVKTVYAILRERLRARRTGSSSDAIIS